MSNNEKNNPEAERAEYMKESVAYHIQDFVNGIADSVNTPYFPTGFPKLDELLDGGLYEGLYIIGAVSSLGKTTLLLQIADQVAQSGTDVLIFSLEMARSELMAKSISRETLLDVLRNNGNIADAKTARGITTGKRWAGYSEQVKNTIYRAINAYSNYANHLYIIEGIGNVGTATIRKKIEQHINLTGHRPLVIIDYLQIVAPGQGDRGASDKQITDRNVMELKRISRDFKIPVFGVSSFNRDNYEMPVSMRAFKESGAVEYSSDVLLGLQFKGVGKDGFDIDKAKSKNPREIELKILKQRNGETGKTVNFEYYALFNYFKEV